MTGRVSVGVSGKIKDRVEELIKNEPGLFLYETFNGFCNYAIKKVLDEEIEMINLFHKLHTYKKE